MKKILLIGLSAIIWINTNAQDGNYVETNGVKIYYQTYGSGEPLLLLHGFLGSHKNWSTWIEDLSKEYLLIVPDLRGHGKSTNPSNIFTHELSAKDMYGLLDKLEIDRFKAIGHSSGGMTLIHMATMDTSRLSAMILVGASPYIPDEGRTIAKRMANSPIDDNLKSFIESRHPGGVEQGRKLLTQFGTIVDIYDDMNFTPPYLSIIKCQTLIVHGDRDGFFPVDIPVSLYEAIPNSFLWILPTTGHYPVGIMGAESIWSDVALKVFNEFLKGKWN
jgi:pimeloyl-ACP methyl ester carboxylesterase